MTLKVFKGEKFKRKMAKLKSGSQQSLITDHSQHSSVEDIPGYLFDVRIFPVALGGFGAVFSVGEGIVVDGWRIASSRFYKLRLN